MDKITLQNLKDNGFIFRKYTGNEQEETFTTTDGEVLIVPTTLELIKSGGEYFGIGDKLDTKEDIANTWITKNQELQEEIISAEVS